MQGICQQQYKVFSKVTIFSWLSYDNERINIFVTAVDNLSNLFTNSLNLNINNAIKLWC